MGLDKGEERVRETVFRHLLCTTNRRGERAETQEAHPSARRDSPQRAFWTPQVPSNHLAEAFLVSIHRKAGITSKCCVAGDVVHRVPRLPRVGAHSKQVLRNKLIEHKPYLARYDDDMLEIRDWEWPLRFEIPAGAQRAPAGCTTRSA